MWQVAKQKAHWRKGLPVTLEQDKYFPYPSSVSKGEAVSYTPGMGVPGQTHPSATEMQKWFCEGGQWATSEREKKTWNTQLDGPWVNWGMVGLQKLGQEGSTMPCMCEGPKY